MILNLPCLTWLSGGMWVTFTFTLNSACSLIFISALHKCVWGAKWTENHLLSKMTYLYLHYLQSFGYRLTLGLTFDGLYDMVYHSIPQARSIRGRGSRWGPTPPPIFSQQTVFLIFLFCPLSKTLLQYCTCLYDFVWCGLFSCISF